MKAIAVLLITVLGGWFFLWDATTVARVAHVRVRDGFVRHPEFIPDASYVKLVSSGFDSLLADLYWLSSIQYIGANVLEAEYKKYLYQLLNLVTDLDERFDYPYELGLLLLPSYNTRYEHFTEDERKFNVDQAVELGKKGLRRSCDAVKVRRILDEEDLERVLTSPELANPCRNPMIPYYLGYVEYWNRKDAKASSDYYKLAAANSDAPKGARIMSAIMRGKSGDRYKAILMFLSIAETLAVEQPDAANCGKFAEELRNVVSEPFQKGIPLPGKFLSDVDAVRKGILAELGEDGADVEIGETHMKCSTYLNKAVRELNLRYVEERDRDFAERTGRTVKDAKELFDAGGMDYLPKDFQTIDETTDIIYVKEDGHWDYSAGRYR